MLIGRRLRLLQAERAEITKSVKFEWVDSMWARSSENLGRDILKSFNPFPGDINAMKIVPSRVFAKAATVWRISYINNTLSTETNLALLHTDHRPRVDVETTTSNRCTVSLPLSSPGCPAACARTKMRRGWFVGRNPAGFCQGSMLR
jgi:hypothetical protein